MEAMNVNTDLLLEVRELRDRLADRTDVLEKVKALTLLPDDLHATVALVASYYEVPKKAIDSLILDHRDELEQDGLRTISGAELISFKEMGVVPKNTASLTIVPRRAILRIGMLLRDSQVAKTVRTYLLNVEEEARIEAPQVVDRAVRRISWREVYSTVNYKKKLGKLIGLSDGTATLLALSHTEREFGVDLSEYKRHIRDDDLDETFSPTELGKRMSPPVSAQRMNRLLAEAGLQRWDEAARAWVLTDAGKPYAKLLPVEMFRPDKNVSTTKYAIRWKLTVLQELMNR
ncbi:hypothetical protein TC41_2459 [Alicyclobacillus acidocaldarius subsp. acidocaldarius Tc-4-1]|uniref:Uncharacterized protein n=2 Tax=Alicyclobacillus acidocaldarius TaxID=405212 RepID=F8IH04_ALIAT|nr:hypothetical protein TC41_2459 [Alicyclobacillus acidocaldarius subsp. acidocaldarius Tc-4-1]